MQKFENMDVIAALEAIMHQNTAYYQSDFAFDMKILREAARSDQPEDRRVHETPSGNQTDFFYCNQSRNGLTLSMFRDSTLKNMPAGQWRCIIGQTDTLLSVSSRAVGAPRCFSLKSGAIITTP